MNSMENALYKCIIIIIIIGRCTVHFQFEYVYYYPLFGSCIQWINAVRNSPLCPQPSPSVTLLVIIYSSNEAKVPGACVCSIFCTQGSMNSCAVMSRTPTSPFPSVARTFHTWLTCWAAFFFGRETPRSTD